MASSRSTGAIRPRRPAPADYRRRVRMLLAAAGAAALVAFVVGLIAGAGHGEDDRHAGERFVKAWERGDYRTMYAQLAVAQRRQLSLQTFTSAYRVAAATATLRSLAAGRARSPRGGVVAVPVTARTRAFGVVRQPLRLPVSDGHVRWSGELVFPGLRAGERLTSRLAVPRRAALLARNGTPLAEGPARSSPLGPVAAQVVGELGPAPPDERAARQAAGFPADTPVGISGLERILESRLAGVPGGTLLAGTRVLAHTSPRPARAVRTSISPGIERAAIAALAGRLGGAAAIDPRTGEVLALAGLAFSGLQPPGSTFKIVTVTAALEAHVTTLRSVYPVRTGAVLEGRTLSNANGESCGGNLVHSFAESCNSVFAPLGVRVGAARLVATAERFGFNKPNGIAGAAISTIPPATQLVGALNVGSSAIGQGQVQATALHMSTVAATIGERGRRPRLTFLAGAHAGFERATSPGIAAKVGRLMRAVVTGGTGTAANIPGVPVAGKTGTAELGTSGTDAWFVAYAPASRPRIAVGVLLVKAGAGGQAAAPAAKTMLLAGLRR